MCDVAEEMPKETESQVRSIIPFASNKSKYGRAQSLLGQLFDEQTVFRRQLKHGVTLENPLEICTHERRTMRSGLRGEEMPKESKVRSICFAVLFQF